MMFRRNSSQKWSMSKSLNFNMVAENPRPIVFVVIFGYRSVVIAKKTTAPNSKSIKTLGH